MNPMKYEPRYTSVRLVIINAVVTSHTHVYTRAFVREMNTELCG